jgi:L-lactate dehydrogenase complex protein LldF
MRARTARAVADPTLQRALRNLDRRLHTAAAVEAEHPDWKDRAAAIRRETLADLDGWLGRLEVSLTGLGVHVHRAETAGAARDVVLDIARRHGATRIAKSKSMATEEIELAQALEADGRSAHTNGRRT